MKKTIDGIEMEVTEKCEFLRVTNDYFFNNYRCVSENSCKDKFNYGGINYCGLEINNNRVWNLKKEEKKSDKRR